MVRYFLLTVFISFLCVYSFRDWYKSLCGLILLMAMIERPDIPKTMLGVPGLNPWNITLLFVVLGFLLAKKKEGLTWDMPRKVNILLWFYLGVILIGVYRLIIDHTETDIYFSIRGWYAPHTFGFITEYLINTVKYAIPGLLIFYGCSTRDRFNWIAVTLSILMLLLAVQIIKWMPLSEIGSGEVLKERSVRILDREIGYHRVDLAAILAGGAWAIYMLKYLFNSVILKNIVYAATFITLLALVLTGGRMGLATCVAIGAFFAFYKWRRLFVTVPIVGLIIVVLLPAVTERFTQGFSVEEDELDHRSKAAEEYFGFKEKEFDLYTITAGRIIAWTYVVDEILDNPIIGVGRQGMINSGVATRLVEDFNEKTLPHPHNAYLEFLLDNGFLGALPIFYLFYLFFKYSLSLFKDSSHTEYIVAGGICLAMLLAHLLASFGSQSFYPREGAVTMWCAIGLMLRTYIQSRNISRINWIKHTMPVTEKK